MKKIRYIICVAMAAIMLLAAAGCQGGEAPPKRWAISWHRSCKNKRAAERMRYISSPPLSEHLRVWVTVWVRRF